MATDKLPPLPKQRCYVWLQEGLEEVEFPVFTAEQMRAYGQASRQQALEEAAKLCAERLDMKEEARAEQASRAAKGTDEELDRLHHWATVSTFNAGIRRCIAALRGLDGQEQESGQ